MMKIQVKVLLGALALTTMTAHADIITDGTVGAPGALAGPNFAIGENLGTTVGNNLFHSFSTFDINFGETATFTGSATLQNVISRVTGTTASSIDGILESQIANADFYFINPNGIIFGSNAVIDVPAAFHFSTAENLVFADANIFSATNPPASTLTAANIANFGFLGTNDIELNGIDLIVGTGSNSSFSAGDVLVEAASTTVSSGSLSLEAETDITVRGSTFDINGTNTLLNIDAGNDILIDEFNNDAILLTEFIISR